MKGFEFADFPVNKDYNVIISKTGVIKRMQAFDKKGRLVAEQSENKAFDESILLLPQEDGGHIQVLHEGYLNGNGRIIQKWFNDRNEIIGSAKQEGSAIVLKGCALGI